MTTEDDSGKREAEFMRNVSFVMNVCGAVVLLFWLSLFIGVAVIAYKIVMSM